MAAAWTDGEIDEVLEAMATHFMDKLSPWEYDFVTSINDQWEQRRSLTDKQREKLAQIWERFARG